MLAPDGRRLGIIELPELPYNLAFGGHDLRTLLVTAQTSLYRIRMAVPGNPLPYHMKSRLASQGAAR